MNVLLSVCFDELMLSMPVVFCPSVTRLMQFGNMFIVKEFLVGSCNNHQQC